MKTQMIEREEYVAKMQNGEWATLGGELMKEREAHGITSSEAARNIGVSRSTLRRFEKGNPVRAARIIESGYRMYLRLVGQAAERASLELTTSVGVHDEPDYGMYLRDGSVVVYCLHSGDEFFSVYKEGYGNIKKAVQHAIKIAGSLGYTPCWMSQEIKSILSTPDLGKANNVACLKLGEDEIIRIWKDGKRTTFESTEELLMHCVDELVCGDSVYTDTAIIEPFENGTYKVTIWENGDSLLTSSIDLALRQLGFEYGGSTAKRFEKLKGIA